MVSSLAQLKALTRGQLRTFSVTFVTCSLLERISVDFSMPVSV